MKLNSSNLIIYNANLVDSSVNSKGMLAVQDGKILGVFLGEVNDEQVAKKIASSIFLEDKREPVCFDAKGLTLMPSFIDMHVHFRYPGQTKKEDLDSGLAAAVAGGFGTVVAMPNTSPVISSAGMAREIMKEVEEKSLAKVFQTVAITKNFEGEDVSEISKLSSEEFPVITEDGSDVHSAAVMLEGMKLAGKQNIMVACHCEDKSLSIVAKSYRARALDFMKKYGIPAGKVNAKTENVPNSVNFEIDGCLTAANQLLALAEDIATERNIEIAKQAGCHIHICHCSTAISMDAVKRAKELIKAAKTPVGFDCTVEVTPHHLGLVGTEAPYLRALVNPPLRSEEDRAFLVEAIKNGTVDVISTDHAPHTQEDKDNGSPGFTGLETSFAVCNSVLVKREGLSLNRLSQLMSENPAKLLKLNSGKILPGYDANLVLVDPDEIWTVNPEKFYSKGKSTPLEDKQLTGRVHATFYKGKQVYSL
ncbi:dihydroorotase [Treponema pectinovorum]|uniref:dihydroorotase n=1 Tax=Treponema pectinovorum TaxID=164 RepID=UPI0011CAAB69|nr:dihydroorotase [Treponema pectinovorum]